MKNHIWLLVAFTALFAVSVTMIGCGKKKSNEKHAATEEAPPADKNPAGEYTFDALCGKLSEEMKAAGTPGPALTQIKRDCEAAREIHADHNEAAEAFVKHIMTACEGKTGMDWFQCYSNDGAAASRAAADAMK